MSDEKQIVPTKNVIVCPHCEKRYLDFIKVVSTTPGGSTVVLRSYWRCRDCVYIFSSKWFNIFNHYNKYINMRLTENGTASL